jgi:hypothetical protein
VTSIGQQDVKVFVDLRDRRDRLNGRLEMVDSTETINLNVRFTRLEGASTPPFDRRL